MCGGSAEAFDVQLGQRIRARRLWLGLSQTELGAALGLSFQQVQKYERGMNRISAGRLYQFAKILDVPINYFFEQMSGAVNEGASYALSDNEQEEFLPGDMMNSKETLDLIRAYSFSP